MIYDNLYGAIKIGVSSFNYLLNNNLNREMKSSAVFRENNLKLRSDFKNKLN